MIGVKPECRIDREAQKSELRRGVWRVLILWWTTNDTWTVGKSRRSALPRARHCFQKWLIALVKNVCLQFCQYIEMIILEPSTCRRWPSSRLPFDVNLPKMRSPAHPIHVNMSQFAWDQGDLKHSTHYQIFRFFLVFQCSIFWMKPLDMLQAWARSPLQFCLSERISQDLTNVSTFHIYISTFCKIIQTLSSGEVGKSWKEFDLRPLELLWSVYFANTTGIIILRNEDDVLWTFPSACSPKTLSVHDMRCGPHPNEFDPFLGILRKVRFPGNALDCASWLLFQGVVANGRQSLRPSSKENSSRFSIRDLSHFSLSRHSWQRIWILADYFRQCVARTYQRPSSQCLNYLWLLC